MTKNTYVNKAIRAFMLTRNSFSLSRGFFFFLGFCLFCFFFLSFFVLKPFFR